MIPLRDDVPGERFPIVTATLIGLNVVVFLWELLLGPEVNWAIQSFGVVPALIVTQWRDPRVLLTLLTGMYLHGGWAHLIGNMLYLGIFGNNVEDRMGHLGFFVFYTVCGLLAWLAEIIAAPTSPIPGVGASGAIAGVLGAYLFLFPRARIKVLVPLPILFTTFYLPAVIVLGIWFITQFFNGLMALNVVVQRGGTAWWAHIGGFVAGIILLPLFRKRRPPPRYPTIDDTYLQTPDYR
ncbi:MAG: rhomboid family intramembrane serine protease [Anaerolineae bacterium]|nr:rhomboid family intramembrane serine protease [Anaerolineae bacterium]